MPKFSHEWSVVKSLASEVLHARAAGYASTWLDEVGGYGNGWCYRRNREMLERIMLRMQFIHDVREPKLETMVLGQSLRLPVLIAPMSETLNVVCGPETMALLGRGARLAGTATSIGHPIREAAMLSMAAEGAPLFRAIKPLKDRDALVEAMKQSERAGCFAIAIDVDAGMGLNPSGYVPKYSDFVQPLSLDELKELRQETALPFILKGVMSVEDAQAAVEIGADAVIVSNHGGHAFDCCAGAIEVLPGIASAVGDQVEVWMDGGVRSGTDVLKALALGASAVLVGRLAIWGLALGGAEGVAHVLEMIAADLRRSMILTGVPAVDSIPQGVLVQGT